MGCVEMTPEVRKKISDACKRNFQGEGNPAHRLTKEQVLDIRHSLEIGTAYKTLAEKYNVSVRLIGKIKNRDLWKEV